MSNWRGREVTLVKLTSPTDVSAETGAMFDGRVGEHWVRLGRVGRQPPWTHGKSDPSPTKNWLLASTGLVVGNECCLGR